MYIIDSAYEHPDIGYMYGRVKDSMETGIAIKPLGDIYKKFAEAQKAAAKTMHSIYGIENPNSTQQVLNYLMNVIDDTIISVCYDEEKDKWTTNKDAMFALSQYGYQFAKDMLIYRKCKGYAQAVKSIMDNTYKDGRIRPKIKLGKTNRIHYSDPAVMSIPKDLIWHIIIPRNIENILYSVDIKQQEPWILANMLGIEELKEIFRSGEDLYREIYRRIFNEDCDKIQRNEIKVSWNAMTYGASMRGLQRICKHIDAKAVYKYFNSLEEFKEYKNKCYKLAKRNAQSIETYFGTTVYADEYGSKLQRVLMDIPIQGTGADILALLIKHFDDDIYVKGIEDKIDLYFSRHDELIIEVAKDLEDDIGEEGVIDILKDIFEHKIDDWDEFNVEINKVKPGEIVLSSVGDIDD